MPSRCQQCSNGSRVGAFSINDNKFYCKGCWGAFPRSEQSQCSRCSARRWGVCGGDKDSFVCERCFARADAAQTSGASPSTNLSQSSTCPDGNGTPCHQCRVISQSGFPSASEKGAYFCATCWEGFSPKDRMPCTVCHTPLPGYFFGEQPTTHNQDKEGGARAMRRFMCTSCIGVFVKRKNEELVLQRQREEDSALLEEQIDFATLRKRPGCRYLDTWLEAVLGRLQLREEDVHVASSIVDSVQQALETTGLTVEVYGSRRTGLTTFGSDYDLLVKVVSQSTTVVSPKKRMDAVALALKGACFDGAPQFLHVSLIHARVPIVRCIHASSGASLDLSFNPVGVLGSQFLCAQLQKPEYCAGRPLIVIVKTLLKSWGLDDANNGGLGSFAVAMMVLWFLRQQQLVDEQRSDAPSNDALSLAVLLMRFLDYFANTFDAKTQGFDILEGKIIHQKSRYCKSPGGICVRHPVDRDANAANGCDKFSSSIQPLFGETAAALNRLARMKFVMTSSEIYSGVDRLMLCPVRLLLGNLPPESRMKNGGDASLSLRPQNAWLDSFLYSGGLGLQLQ